MTERVLEFDLNGLPYSSIDRDFLRGLEKVLRFEGLLKYVALPPLVVEDCKGLGGDTASGGSVSRLLEQDQVLEPKGRGLEYLCDVFHWLKNRGVKSVVKITVMDNGEETHSDEAIEACLNGLDVRIWQWYKIDLCSDVILHSARGARDVTLYSSGNNAVLMGWASPAGLAQLQELKTVHVFHQEGLERSQRLEGYFENFKTQLINNWTEMQKTRSKHQTNATRPKKDKPEIKVTWCPHSSDSTYDAVFAQRDAGKAVETRWMDTMKHFGGFLRQASKADRSVKPIKIAVIDDGINTKDPIFTNRIQTGESFHQLGEFSGRWGAFYVPSGEHGTLMARLICEICPVVKLYIAQLEVFDVGDGRRSFNAESAAEAVRWAKKQGVDIISMSWSIKASHATQDLETALEEAANDHIIMFCSSTDEGATVTDKTYPGLIRSCIKIGASTDTGAKLSWVSSDSDFLLPGDALQGARETGVANSPRKGPHSQAGLFGSSVSTALAAGLAGVLLYCDRLLQASRTISSSAERQEEEHTGDDRLKQASAMSSAFTALSVKSQDNYFLQVWDYFPTETLVWDSDRDYDETERTRARLETFMNTLKK